MTSSPETAPHSTSELTAPLDARRRVSIASDPPTVVDGRRSPYFGGQETRRRLSVVSSDHQASEGRRKSILVQHTPDTMSVHSHHSGNTHYVNHAFQPDGESVQAVQQKLAVAQLGLGEYGLGSARSVRL
jgi:hypothetical protein